MARAVTAFKFSGASAMPVTRMDDLVTGYLRYRRKHFGVLLQQAWSIIVFKAVVTAGLLILGTSLVVNRQITLGQFVASELVIVTVLAAAVVEVEQLPWTLWPHFAPCGAPMQMPP